METRLTDNDCKWIEDEDSGDLIFSCPFAEAPERIMKSEIHDQLTLHNLMLLRQIRVGCQNCELEEALA